ncbi:MAG: YidC/Oxa1 family membrane protein insertase [Clostridia bacterium]|nr:YidC/Oxa1 family membrane protein insertase [Clostridia bacterium]
MKAILSRGVLILAVLVFVGAALTGCSGNAAKHTIAVGDCSTTAENSLDKDTIKQIANEIVETQGKTMAFGSKEMNVHTAIVAAYNGYDVTAEGFNDEKLPEAQPERANEFVYNVLAAADASDKIEFDIDLVKLTDIAAEGSDEVVLKINNEDVKVLVGALQTSVDTSGADFLGTILHWIGVAFSWIINTLGFGSFILGSLFFAILVEIIMLPVSIKQQKNNRRQALLRPKEMAIRKKYAGRNDNVTMQKVQTEIQEMYQKEGFNPMTAGCLPMILSMIIILPLYYIVIDPVQYILGCTSGVSNALITFATAPHAAGGLGLALRSNNGTIELLSLLGDNLESVAGIESFAFFSNGADVWGILEPALAKGVPDFSVFGVNFGLIPTFGEPWVLLAIPVLTFVVYFFSMKLSRKMSYQPTQAANDKATGCSNGMMDVMMPLFSVYITFIVPAAVGVYWIFKSIISTLKQFIMSKVMPLPKFTEEDYKAAERELMGKEKKKPKKPSGTRNPNVRSLHHIDDEDFIVQKPETNGHGGVKKQTPKADAPEQQTEDAPESKAENSESAGKTKTSLIDGVNLKDDKTETDKND